MNDKQIKKLPYYHKCYVCGKSNKAGFQLTFYKQDDFVFAKTILDEKYIGYEGIIHGGVIATLVDEAMGWACIAKNEKFYYTTNLEVKYIRPVHPGEEIVVSAYVNKEDGKLLLTEANIKDKDDKILVKAWGKFFPAKQEDKQRILDYLSFDDNATL